VVPIARCWRDGVSQWRESSDALHTALRDWKPEWQTGKSAVLYAQRKRCFSIYEQLGCDDGLMDTKFGAKTSWRELIKAMAKFVNAPGRARKKKKKASR
jgi:hypothetical protein